MQHYWIIWARFYNVYIPWEEFWRRRTLKRHWLGYQYRKGSLPWPNLQASKTRREWPPTRWDRAWHSRTTKLWTWRGHLGSSQTLALSLCTPPTRRGNRRRARRGQGCGPWRWERTRGREWVLGTSWLWCGWVWVGRVGWWGRRGRGNRWRGRGGGERWRRWGICGGEDGVVLERGGIEGGRRRFGRWGWEGEGSRQRSRSLLKPWLSNSITVDQELEYGLLINGGSQRSWSMAY